MIRSLKSSGSESGSESEGSESELSCWRHFPPLLMVLYVVISKNSTRVLGRRGQACAGSKKVAHPPEHERPGRDGRVRQANEGHLLLLLPNEGDDLVMPRGGTFE